MAEISSTTNTPTYDYSNIGSVGSEAAQSVNGEMINKIRAAEEKAKIDPITKDIDNIALEQEKIEEIKTKITEFQDVVNYFDIYNDENVFNQHLFDVSGNSAVFDAVNKSKLKEGTTSLNVSQLAQNDVFQSSKFSDASATIAGGQDSGDKITITVGTNAPIEISTEGKTYQDLVNEINQNDSISASVEQVGDGEYRLIVKGADTGEANKVTINQSGLSLGFGDVKSSSISNWDDTLGVGAININGQDVIANTLGMTYTQVMDTINAHADFNAVQDGDTIRITGADGSSVSVIEDGANGLNFADSSHIQKAQNLNATIDGVEYDVSSNSITTQDGALKITAIKVNEPNEITSITISKDSSAVTVAAEAMVSKYNELYDLINDELYSEESTIEDKSTLRTIMSDLKNMLFANYGAEEPIQWGDAIDDYGDTLKEHSNVTNNDKNIFTYGFEIDKTGHLKVDTEEFNKNVKDNMDDLAAIFTGVYENKGLGVQLKEYLDNLDGYEGLLTNYETNMIEKKEDLEKDKKDALESLDSKYGIMAEQFSAYSAIIAQMEAQFSGLKMMIQQSVASN